MYEVGAWFVYLMNGAILAILAVVALVAILVKRNQYAKEAKECILVEILMPTGWSVYRVVKPLPDGWVKVGKGDYKLAVGEDNPGTLTDEERCQRRKEYKLNTAAKRWAYYPMRPFLGLKALQVPIRTESFYYNNPEPITWPEHRVKVTAVDAQAHTRQMDAMNVGVQIQESDARQKQLVEAINNQPNKIVVYIMLGGAILVGVMNLVQWFSSSGG